MDKFKDFEIEDVKPEDVDDILKKYKDYEWLPLDDFNKAKKVELRKKKLERIYGRL